MPEKLMRCIDKVMESGKSESEAWAICQKSTGLKPHKEKSKRRSGMFTQEQIEKLVALADRLDEQGLQKEADRIDGLIKESGWLSNLWNKLTADPDVKRAYKYLQEGHQNLSKHFTDALQQLKAAGGNLKAAKDLEQMQAYVAAIKEIKIKLETSLEEVGTLWKAVQEIQTKINEAKGVTEKMRGGKGGGAPAGAAGAGPQRPEGIAEKTWNAWSPEQQQAVLDAIAKGAKPAAAPAAPAASPAAPAGTPTPGAATGTNP